MNISPWTIYWITILDSVCVYLFCIGLLCLIIGFIYFMSSINTYNEKEKYIRQILAVLSIILGILIWTIEAFLPDTKSAAAILIIPKIVNDDKVAALPSKIVDLAGLWIDSLKPQKSTKDN